MIKTREFSVEKKFEMQIEPVLWTIGSNQIIGEPEEEKPNQ